MRCTTRLGYLGEGSSSGLAYADCNMAIRVVKRRSIEASVEHFRSIIRMIPDPEHSAGLKVIGMQDLAACSQ